MEIPTNFPALDKTGFRFVDGLNVISGPPASGKTSLIRQCTDMQMAIIQGPKIIFLRDPRFTVATSMGTMRKVEAKKLDTLLKENDLVAIDNVVPATNPSPMLHFLVNFIHNYPNKVILLGVGTRRSDTWDPRIPLELNYAAATRLHLQGGVLTIVKSTGNILPVQSFPIEARGDRINPRKTFWDHILE